MKKMLIPITLMLALVVFDNSALARPLPRRNGRSFPQQQLALPAVLQAVSAQLDLSDEQKQEIAAILKANKDELKADIASVIEARTALFETIHADVFDEGAIRAAAKSAGDAEAELAVLRAEIVQSVRAVLTPEQQQKLQELKASLKDRIESRIEQLKAKLEAWLLKQAD